MIDNKLQLTIYRESTGQRKGGVVPFIAFLLPVFFIFIALAVDYGGISLAKHQLQNAADAAAMATMQVYMEERDQSDEAAFEVITSNRLQGRPIDFDIDQSIEYGTWDPDSSTFAPISRNGRPTTSTDFSGSSIPLGATAVRVTLRRDPADGNGLRLFLGPIFGTDHATVVARGIASASPS